MDNDSLPRLPIDSRMRLRELLDEMSTEQLDAPAKTPDEARTIRARTRDIVRQAMAIYWTPPKKDTDLATAAGVDDSTLSRLKNHGCKKRTWAFSCVLFAMGLDPAAAFNGKLVRYHPDGSEGLVPDNESVKDFCDALKGPKGDWLLDCVDMAYATFRTSPPSRSKRQ